ncbi:hypothetical protein [Nonomuraea zeae]|uniref:Uncharacterized protein n=1 Tax=Nonomuraea zeae TaxID=1642303 RepID=A0A5S4FEB7_9ACTN|nr:hypothetical protein [Nonomuraea zeae]TMR17048.1 hypothetical protein ETD85_54615 [Nonomuraea zeae]
MTYALRTPWYELVRQRRDPLGEAAGRPFIQMYDTPGFVERLTRDPRDSLRMGEADEFAVPVPALRSPTTGAGYRMAGTGALKLYQPNHDRFYALVIELFCDQPGLPLPGGGHPGAEVGFVVRRLRTTVGDAGALRRLARSLAGRPAAEDADLDQLARHARPRDLTPDERRLLDRAALSTEEEAWVTTADGRGAWTPVSGPPALLPGEQEHRMWRLPPSAAGCTASQARSLWFGVVPTLSGDLDRAGAPKLDDQSLYQLRCFARIPRQAPCPPTYRWSEATAPYRLAAFFDPQGTRNRRVTITTPDFRATAAQASRPGRPYGPGGVEFVQPPQSRLSFRKGKTLPDSGTQAGEGVQHCTYAIELLSIVAFFVFSVFLPIVTFVFGLWWLLLLRFCWPSASDALTTVIGHLSAGGTIASTSGDTRTAMDEVLGGAGATDLLIAALPDVTGDSGRSRELVDSLHRDSGPPLASPPPLDKPDDPICRTGKAE